MESGILYNAIFENEKTLKFDMGILGSFDNVLTKIAPGYEDLEDIVFVYDVSAENFHIFHDMKNERTLCASSALNRD